MSDRRSFWFCQNLIKIYVRLFCTFCVILGIVIIEIGWTSKFYRFTPDNIIFLWVKKMVKCVGLQNVTLSSWKCVLCESNIQAWTNGFSYLTVTAEMAKNIINSFFLVTIIFFYILFVQVFFPSVCYKIPGYDSLRINCRFSPDLGRSVWEPWERMLVIVLLFPISMSVSPC